jgi:hypothetical protein
VASLFLVPVVMRASLLVLANRVAILSFVLVWAPLVLLAMWFCPAVLCVLVLVKALALLGLAAASR